MKREVFVKEDLFNIEMGHTKNLEKYLRLWFGSDENLKEKRMDSVSHPKVLVSAVTRKATHVQLDWFNNFLDHNSRDLVWKVARYTSAAPFYFRPEDRYIDGGLLAPNPSLHALTTIQDHLRRSGSDVGVSLVVSIGAGINQISDYSKIKMNMSNILVPGLSVPVLRFFGHVIESHSVVCEKSCRRMCKEQGIEYVRLNPLLETEVDPAETDNRKIIDMLWTTRKYMHLSAHHLHTLQFYAHHSH
jgi:calcium-independent phospholipase A2